MVKSPKAQGEEVLGDRASPLSEESLLSLKSGAPNKSRGLLNLQAKPMLAVLGVGAFKEGLPHLKRQRAVSRGNA